MTLQEAATILIGEKRYYGESYYLRKLLRMEFGIHLSPRALRKQMQELADAGHFERSYYPVGSQGYTWSLPETVDR